MTTRVVIDRGERVWTATLDGPDRRNALSGATRDELQALVRELADSPDVAVLVVQGAGSAFSGGADLKAVPTSEPPTTWAGRRHASSLWQRMLDEWEGLPQVTVARLHGSVVGGAALLAASCDLRIASDDVAFSIPELFLGIPLTWAGLPRLAREIGVPMTRDLVMTGRVLRGREVLECGVAQRMVPAADIEKATLALVDELLRMPAAPLAMTKAAMAAIGRADGAFAASWADPDLLMWSFGEAEGRQAAVAYAGRLADERATRGKS